MSYFKIGISLESLEVLLDSTFWSSGAFVSEFDHNREKPTRVNVAKVPEKAAKIKTL